jgi:hypothetical protein
MLQKPAREIRRHQPRFNWGDTNILLSMKLDIITYELLGLVIERSSNIVSLIE